MNSLINISHLPLANKAVAVFCQQLIATMASNHPNDTFYITAPLANQPQNVQLADINLSSWLTMKLALSGFIKKYQIDQYIHCGDEGTVPELKIPVHVCLHAQMGTTIPLTFERKAKWSKLFAHANTIIVSTDTEKELLQENFETLANKNLVAVGVAIDEVFAPIDDLDKEEAIREKYSHEQAFIYCPLDKAVDDTDDIIQLLKGFSLLKNRHRNSIQLLFHAPEYTDKFIDKLSTYKYRSDVLMLSDLNIEEQAQLTAVANLVVCIEQTGFATQALASMRSATLAITGVNSLANYFAGDTIVYYDKLEASELFVLFNKFYVNEHLQKQHIINAFSKSIPYNFADVAAVFKAAIS